MDKTKPVARFSTSGFGARFTYRIGGFGEASCVSHGRLHGVSLCARCTVTTTGRTIRSSKVSLRGRSLGEVNMVCNMNVKNVRAFRRRMTGCALGGSAIKPGFGPFFVPGVVTSVTSKRVSVVCNFRNPGFAAASTYTSSSGTVTSTFGCVHLNGTGMVITNNTRTTVFRTNLNNFGTVRTLSAHGSSPRHTSHPFDTDHSNFIVNRNTNYLVLRRLRRTGTHNTGVCTRLTNMNTSTSTCRLATSRPRKLNTGLIVLGTLRSTRLGPRSVSCVGMRKASAPMNSISRIGTVGSMFKSRTCGLGVDSAGSVAKRLLNTTNTMRTVTDMLTIGGSVIPPAVGRRRNSGSRGVSCGLGFAFGRTRGHAMGTTLDGAFNFNKRGTYMVMGGCTRWSYLTVWEVKWSFFFMEVKDLVFIFVEYLSSVPGALTSAGELYFAGLCR